MIDLTKEKKNFDKKNKTPPYEVWLPEIGNDSHYVVWNCDFEQTVRNFMKLVYKKFLKEEN